MSDLALVLILLHAAMLMGALWSICIAFGVRRREEQ